MHGFNVQCLHCRTGQYNTYGTLSDASYYSSSLFDLPAIARSARFLFLRLVDVPAIHPPRVNVIDVKWAARKSSDMKTDGPHGIYVPSEIIVRFAMPR